MVAVAAHFAALADGRDTFYTAPIKALVSEKFFALCAIFGAENVGMLTGDASVNSGAPIICCTAEVLANIALREGADADVGQVVMDEFHFYAEPQRGWAWQVPILSLPQAQFLLMSATLGDVSVAAGGPDAPHRPRHRAGRRRRAPRPAALLVVARAAARAARGARADATRRRSTSSTSRRRRRWSARSRCCRRSSARARSATRSPTRSAASASPPGFGKTLSKLVRAGIGVHHAGMLPRYRRLVEQLAQTGLLKVICGTDTLGVGINVPIRTVVFTGLAKFDGTNHRLLKAREFHQIAGRAGRAGFDTSGYVVVQAPEHAIENARRVAKAGDDPLKKLKRVQTSQGARGRRSAGPRRRSTRLRDAMPEALVSRMRVNHAIILNLINQRGDPASACARCWRTTTRTSAGAGGCPSRPRR